MNFGNFLPETIAYLRMTGPFDARKTILACVFASFLLYGGYPLAQHESMDCSLSPTTHVKLAGGDQNTTNHLQASRKVTAGTSIDLNSCAAPPTLR